MNLFSNSRNFYLQQIFTFLVSMIIFGVYLISVQRTGLLFNSFHEGSDMLAYIHNALQGLEGNWPGKEPFYRAPGYSFFLTICFKQFFH